MIKVIELFTFLSRVFSKAIAMIIVLIYLAVDIIFVSDIALTYFLDLWANKKVTIYTLFRKNRISNTTLTNIASEKADILDCSGNALLAISKSLDISDWRNDFFSEWSKT